MNPYNFAVLFFAFCTFIVSLIIWFKRNDRVGKIYFLYSLAAAIWGIGFSIKLGDNVPYGVALFAIRVAHLGSVLIPVTFFHFVLIFTNQEGRYKKLLQFFYLLAIIIECFVFSPLFIPRLAPILDFVHYARPGPVYYIFTGFFFSVVPLAFLFLINQYRHSCKSERAQVLGLIIAKASGFLGGFLTFLPVYKIGFPQYGLFLMPLYPLITAYFVMKKKLFNIESVVQAAHRDKLAAMGTLATSINHEVRNPLYVIQGLAESHLRNLKEGVYQSKEIALEKANGLAVKTVEQTKRAIEIMRKFSNFAKRDTRGIQLDNVSLNSVLNDVVPLINYELELDEIELIRKVPHDLPLVEADRRHLEEIFFNLIVNSCQAMKATGGKIEILAETKNKGVVVTITDDGPGISPDQEKHIFEPFYTTRQEGTGLGLYITKQLIEKNGGKITVESKPNKGSIFKLVFKKL